MGCGFAIVLIGLALLTGTVMSGLPSLGAPVRIQLTAAATTAANLAKPVLPSPPPTAFVPVPTQAPSQVPASVATSTLPADNPWVAIIPEAGCIPTDIPQTGRVVEVIDAETIRVLMDQDGRVYGVRYLGVDIPAGLDRRVARNGVLFNIGLTYNKHVSLVRDLTDQDGSGRLLRYVMVDRTFVNYALIAAGFARAELAPPDTSCYAAFSAVEQQAQSQALGLWAPPTISP